MQAGAIGPSKCNMHQFARKGQAYPWIWQKLPFVQKKGKIYLTMTEVVALCVNF